MSSRKKHIYIPIELKNRELDSQVILAAEACSKGFRVYLGSHAAIYNALSTKKDRAGVFLDKGTQVEGLTKWIRTKCEYIFVLDQELNPSLQVSRYLPNENLVESRFYSGTKELIDGFFCVGPVIFDSAQNYFNDRRVIFKTGWPRIDLQRRYAMKIYHKQIQDLREKYGDFLLFVSDFGVLVPISEIKSPERVKTLLGEFPFEFWEKTHQDFEQIIHALRIWDSNPLVPKVIVRPHIMDDMRIWKQKLRGLIKTQVIHSGDITPWIGASEGVIHRGSTVSIQAALMNKKVFYLEEASTSHNRLLVKEISDFVVGAKEPPSQDHLLQVTSNNVEEALSRVIYTYDESSSVEIRRVLLDQDISIESPITRFRVLLNYSKPRAIRRFLGLIRDEIMYSINSDFNPPQSKSIPKGIRRKDIEVGMLAEVHFSEIHIRKIGINLWEFDNTK